ncbi:hypothetical protein BVJ53_12320 [Lacticaseibacillus chiayiensis]|uniref:Competence protein ComGE n=1 Tax=Lacticaseibacillus chiayiensis TaxID=2100821 RepID=A0A4V1P021_9LACO|nr:hypothetical protein KG086_04285 [Lacticaseibacillus chiayiensis]RXT19000.1 hypothetical protein BVJ53_12320 [Lacticaseibacillus chiayiensis]RXT59492.1 hypothetical protein CHT97_00675 [Lacticaseibacillus chiayiensis]
MGASNIRQNKLSAVLLVEHLASLGVVLIAASWLTLLIRTYQKMVIPARQETTAYYAARVALVRLPSPGGKTEVKVGPDVWQVEVHAKEVVVHADNKNKTFSFTP